MFAQNAVEVQGVGFGCSHTGAGADRDVYHGLASFEHMLWLPATYAMAQSQVRSAEASRLLLTCSSGCWVYLDRQSAQNNSPKTRCVGINAMFFGTLEVQVERIAAGRGSCGAERLFEASELARTARGVEGSQLPGLTSQEARDQDDGFVAWTPSFEIDQLYG